MISQQGTPKNSPEASLREGDPVLLTACGKERSQLNQTAKEKEKCMQWEDFAIASNFYISQKKKKKMKKREQ